MSLRIGLVGPGRVGKRLANALRSIPEVSLHSLFARDIKKAESFLQELGLDSSMKKHNDIMTFFQDLELDGVVIATPDNLHYEHTLMALKHHKHVFVEKPLATTIDHARRMIDKSQKKSKVLSVGYHLRWHDGIRQMIKKIHRGELGELSHMKLNWAYQFPDAKNWRATGEQGPWWSLSALGTHCLDLILWAMGPSCGSVVRVEGHKTNEYWRAETDETSSLKITFESGALGEINCSVLTHIPLSIEIKGSQGEAVGSKLTHDERSILFKDQSLSFQKNDPYKDELIDFARSITDQRPPEVSHEDALENIRILCSL